ncbi:MAG: hypothetical protein AABX93_01605 [Nanoarchaeota archaeon]
MSEKKLTDLLKRQRGAPVDMLEILEFPKTLRRKDEEKILLKLNRASSFYSGRKPGTLYVEDLSEEFWNTALETEHILMQSHDGKYFIFLPREQYMSNWFN